MSNEEKIDVEGKN